MEESKDNKSVPEVKLVKQKIKDRKSISDGTKSILKIKERNNDDNLRMEHNQLRDKAEKKQKGSMENGDADEETKKRGPGHGAKKGKPGLEAVEGDRSDGTERGPAEEADDVEGAGEED